MLKRGCVGGGRNIDENQIVIFYMNIHPTLSLLKLHFMLPDKLDRYLIFPFDFDKILTLQQEKEVQ